MIVKNPERALLGCILLGDKVTFGHCLRYGVKDEWFLDSDNRKFYAKALNMFGRNMVADSITMDDGSNGEVIRDMTDVAITVYNAPSYISLIESAYLLSTAEKMNTKHTDLINSRPEEVQEMLNTIRNDWMHVGSENQIEPTLLEVGNDLVTEWETPPSDDSVVSWPLSNLQRHIGNISDDYIFLVASESVGKTALALQMCMNLAYKGVMSSFASLESSLRRIMPRLIAMKARVNTHHMKNGKGTPQQIQACRDAVKEINALPMRITERSMSIDQLHAWALVEKAAGSKFLIVDNMKHIRMPMSNKKTNEHFREISLRIKWIRDDLKMPIMVLHHLTEDGDVSWSKDIKRDADILLYMTLNENQTILPTQENNFMSKWVNDLEIRKNRDAEAGFCVQTRFKKKIQTFEEV